MPKEIGRGRACSVSASAKHSDNISHISSRKLSFVCEPIKRRTQAADNIGHFVPLCVKSACDRDWIIAAHNRAEIAGGSELMMQPSVGHEIGDAVAYLTVNYAREINACFTDKKTPKFQTKLCLGQLWRQI